MNEENRLNSLEVALNNELKERAFYLNHSQRTSNPVGKAMFQQIADEELEHYERLKQLHDLWQQQKKWPETVPLQVKNTNVKDVLKNMLKQSDSMPKGEDDDLQAIQTAIEFEARGAAFYAELRDSVADPQEKQFFNLLATIENEHYLSLKDTEEFLTDPVSWYRIKEHHHLDGG
ncbi:MAG TPA: ferritin family protein [Thermodesulfobacteriota bacterium]|nr:ferritin family protein [Thermodesulfobacteriota bacterium]HNU71671.1 ferritin family protein [Thermodesulfobacteriota bacterium]HOC38280.1 ferritin family protein [Thermodesulfobacteriota bacterium]HQO79397.1 ferritin family protein [Thermodesulfobacteriota bacterium]